MVHQNIMQGLTAELVDQQLIAEFNATPQQRHGFENGHVVVYHIIGDTRVERLHIVIANGCFCLFELIYRWHGGVKYNRHEYIALTTGIPLSDPAALPELYRRVHHRVWHWNSIVKVTCDDCKDFSPCPIATT